MFQKKTPEGVDPEKNYFFRWSELREFFLKSLHFFAKNRSSRDLFKNEVLDQNFDFRSPHTPPTLANFHFFDKFPLISHCKLHWICPKLTKSGTPLGRTPLKELRVRLTIQLWVGIKYTEYRFQLFVFALYLVRKYI